MNTEKDEYTIENLTVQVTPKTTKYDLWFNRILGLLSFVTLVVAIIYFVTVLVKQMASVLGLTLTAVREGIANNHYKAFAYCYGKGKKRTFVIDRFGFETYLARTGRSEEYIKEAFNNACIS